MATKLNNFFLLVLAGVVVVITAVIILEGKRPTSVEAAVQGATSDLFGEWNGTLDDGGMYELKQLESEAKAL